MSPRHFWPKLAWASTPFVVVAKAGGSDEGPENTLAAIAAALRIEACAGVEVAVEIDVRLTSDGHLVLIHDETLERTTNGTGRVAEHSLAQLQRVRAAQTERIPALEEAIEATRDRQLLIEPHLAGRPMLDGLVRCLERAGKSQRQRLIVASEHSRLIYALRARCPDVQTAATAKEAKLKLILDNIWLGACSPRWPLWIVPERYRGVTVLSERFLANAQRNRDQVWAYVINDAAHAQKLRERGVAGVITTSPRKLVDGLGAS